ncbi:hypothetical protein LTR56_010436 [Elasticomyces elasticus]|nr:hypothetical protein LTR56_010436 [Elasticomyces elasticus]KAK3648472.1 hypothetical protein LTR22_013364 [Elasticomyces elasticus]KAK4916781.1 hypothetical protein LTR49_015225 [Elasticomyces elasticus]KAK5755931.1 hypothetical protein LTS12_013935 [Elasticomyces elasticus]
MQLTIELLPIKSCNISCSHGGTCIPDEAGLKLVVICADNATIADLLRIGTERLWENFFGHARCVKLAKVRDHLGAIMTPSIKLRDLSTPSLPPPACILKVVPNRCLTTAGSTMRSANAINTSSAIPISNAPASSSSASFANSPTIAPAIVSKKRKREKTAPVRAPATKRPKTGPKAGIPTPRTAPQATQQRQPSSDIRELWKTQPPPTSAQRARPETQQSMTSRPVQPLVLSKPTQQPAPTQSSNEEDPDDMALAGFPKPIVDDIVDDDGSDIILDSQSDSSQPKKFGTRRAPVASKFAGRKSTCKTKKFRAHEQSGKTDLIGAALKKSSQPKPSTNPQPSTMPQRSPQANSSSSQHGTAATNTNKFDKRGNSEDWTPLERQVVAEGIRAGLNAKVIEKTCFGPARSHSGVRNCKNWILKHYPLAFCEDFDTSEIGGTPAGTALQAFQMARERGERPPVRVYPEMLESDESLKTAGYENMAGLVRDSTTTREGAMGMAQSSQDLLVSGGLPEVEPATSQPAVDHRRSSSSVQVEDGITDGPAYASSNHALPASSDTGATSGAVDEAQAADSDKHDTEDFADIDDIIAGIASSDAATAENNSTIVGATLTEGVAIASSPPVMVDSSTVQVSETPADEQITEEPTPTQTHANTSLTQQTVIPDTLVDNATQASRAAPRRLAKQQAAAHIAGPASLGKLIPVLPLPTSTQLAIFAQPTTTRSLRSRTAGTSLTSTSGALTVREPMRSRALNGGLVYPPAGINNASVTLSELASAEASGSDFGVGDDMSEHLVDAEMSDGDGVGEEIMQRIASGDEAEKAKKNEDEDVEELDRIEPTSDLSEDDVRSPVTIGPPSKLPLARRLSKFREEANRIEIQEEANRMVRAARSASPDGPVRMIGIDGKVIEFGNEPIKDRIIEDVTDEDNHAGAEDVKMTFNSDEHMEGEVAGAEDVVKNGDEDDVVKQEPVEQNVEQEEEVVDGALDGFVFAEFRAKDAKPSRLIAPMAAYGYGMDDTNEAPPPSWVPRSSQTPPANTTPDESHAVVQPVIKQEPVDEHVQESVDGDVQTAVATTPAGKTEEEKAVRRQQKQERRAKRRSIDPAEQKAVEKARRREARSEKRRIKAAKKAAKLRAGHAEQVVQAIAA